MILVDNSPVKYAMYSGDINNDGTVELSDLIEVYTGAVNFISGDALHDLNGDNTVNLNDLLICYNSASSFAETIKP